MDLSPDQVDGKDINSVAGVLKLYFRELREPLFPFSIFHDLIDFISNNSFTSERQSFLRLTDQVYLTNCF